MAANQLPPHVAAELSKLKGRVTDLERSRRTTSAPSPTPEPESVFSLPGPLYLAGPSAPLTDPGARRIVQLVASLATAGSTATTIDVHVNGTAVESLSIPAGERTNRITVDRLLGPDDQVAVAVSLAGVAAADLAVQIRFRPGAGQPVDPEP